ncbi:hypothetical protein [Actinoplanes sp. NPDC026623]|uniref:hypothetical protein n=1 Tax=Actinoplanes sp. NPDC026623 TaxID=3155610 RepID=UPI0034027591
MGVKSYSTEDESKVRLTSTPVLLGICGIAAGALALGTEAMPALDLYQNARAASFRVLLGLAVILLLTASFLTTARLARSIEAQPTDPRPVVDAFLLGLASRDTSDTDGHRGDVDTAAGGHIPDTARFGVTKYRRTGL